MYLATPRGRIVVFTGSNRVLLYIDGLPKVHILIRKLGVHELPRAHTRHSVVHLQ